MASLADALRQFGPAYLNSHLLSTPQAKAWRGIVACRTSALGGERLACDTCGHSHWQYHSCRNRHCPQCGARAKDAWLQGRLSEILNVPYVHLVFTLPHSLNDLCGAHPRWVIDALFASTAQTLTEFAANPKWMGTTGCTPAFSLVLHTWGQELQRHIHVHAVMACGVLDKTGQWATPVRKPDFLFPTPALSAVFRGKFMAALTTAHTHHQLECDPQGAPLDWSKRQRQLYKHDWVVYAKAPLGGPAQVLEYLSRYTHCTAIGNERIRHYGVLASACKGSKLNAARLALQMPAINAQALESAQAFMARVARLDVGLCPVCKMGHLRTVEVLAGARRLPVAGSMVLPQERGPP